MENYRMPLTKIHIASYGVGHVLNDMSGAVWFSYVLLYLQDAEGLSGTQAGWVMFSGQVADALATILVGLASDAGQGCCFLGRRKAWNLAGVVIVAINFGIMFGQVFPGWATMRSVGKAVVLGVAASLFNVGWAACQVSHMSLVPELTSDMRERVTLNSVRYGFTVLSNCAVFLVMLALLPDASAQVDDPRYRQPSLYQDLATVVLCVGLAFSAFFLLFCKEPSAEELRVREEAEAEEEAHQQQQQRQQQTADLEQEELGSGDEEGLEEPLLPPSSALWKDNGAAVAFYEVRSWKDWLKVPDFWRVMAVYMLVRLSVNISQVYLTFFVTETLAMSSEAVALTPLLLYLAQLVGTMVSRPVAERLGRQYSVVAGSLLTIAACVSMLFIERGAFAAAVYGSVVVLGAGMSISMVMSVSIEADLIGNRVGSAAFVYGACSFSDKMLSGIFILGIQYLRNISYPTGSPHHSLFILLVNTTVPAAAALLAALVALTIRFPQLPTALQSVGGLEGGGLEDAALEQDALEEHQAFFAGTQTEKIEGDTLQKQVERVGEKQCVHSLFAPELDASAIYRRDAPALLRRYSVPPSTLF